MPAAWPPLAVLCVLVLLRAAEIEAACRQGDKFVENVFPNKVSMAGGVRITIQGCGFEANQYDNPDNAVYLESDLGETFATEKHIDKNTESQMTVYTPSGLDPDKLYHLRLTLGGETWDDNVMCSLHPENCAISASWDITPTIESMSFYSGLTGALVHLYGKIFTTRYGTNIEVSDNDCNYRILRVWFGGQLCELKNSTTNKDDFYGLQLDNSTTDYGIMVCKPERKAPGNVQINFVLEDQYGSSMAAGIRQRASRDQGVHIYEAFAEVSDIFPRRCGPGCHLKVYGSNLNSEENGYSEVLAFVGGQSCNIVDVVPGEYLTCEVPNLTAVLPNYAGGRGQITSLWSGQTGPTDDAMRTLAVAPDKTVLTDEAHFCNDDVTMDRMVMTFFFVASVTGPYSFGLNATTSGTLFLNGVEVAASSGGIWGDSATTFDLVADEWNTIDAVASAVPGGESGACITVRSVQYNTRVSNIMSELSTPEEQRIELTSDVQYQRWSLEFKNFASSTPTPEIQTVSVQNDGQIQLSLFGVSTVPIEFDDDAREYIETALNQLPFLGDGENFSVGPVSAGSFDITFNSGRGDIPNFTCGGPVCTVAESQKGEPDNGKLSFLMNGTPSPVISYTDDTTEFTQSLTVALETMFSAVCPDMFHDANASFTDSFETMSSPQAVTDIPAFSGRKSRKNPWMFFSGKKNLRTPNNKWMCFAVNGLDNNNIRIKFTRARPSASGGYESEVRYRWYTFDTIPAEGSGSPGWNYTCINLQAKIQNSNTGWDNFDLEGAYLRNDPTIDFFVDAVQLIGDTQVAVQLFQHQLAINGTLNNLCLGPARANMDEVFTIDAVDVQLDATAPGDVYLVELRPNDCGTNFQPIKLSDEGGSASLIVQELSSAQPPISGSYTLMFKDKLITVDGNISDANLTLLLKDKLYDQLGGDVSVARSRASTCANMFIHVKMIGVGGDQPLIEVVSSELNPPSASVSIVPVTDGKYTHDPVYGTYSRTSFKKPQVQVFINGVMSRCGLENHDCFLDFDSSILPVVNSINPVAGAPLSTVTITGSGFDAVSEKNIAYIGDTICEILTASETQLTCTVGDGKAGPAVVKVKVVEKGNSTGSVTFTNQAVVTDFSPTEGGIGGGLILTMTGSGFSDNIEVLVGAYPCLIIGEVLPDQVTCVIPLYEDAVQGEGDYTVEVAVYANAGDESPVASPGQFTYRWDCTPIVDTVSTSEELTVAGGQLVTVQGSGLGTNEVFVVGKEAVVLRNTDTEMEFRTPPGLDPEEILPIDIWNGGRESGCRAVQFEAAVKRRKRNSAKQAKKPKLPNVQLAWSGVSPTGGSMLGGTRLTIEGKGFGENTSNVKVTVGTTDCKVEKSTRTAIECKLESTVKTHEVNNWDMEGKDTYLGFSQSTVTICLSDIVHWQWTLPSWLTGVSLTLVQVKCSNPMEPIEGGIREPGNQARQGHFKHQFVKTGTYCFANGPFDKYKRRSSSMEVNVIDCTAEVVDVKVDVNGKTAKFKKGGSVAGSCTSTGALTSCPTTPAQDGKYVFDPCLTPSGLTPSGIEMTLDPPFPDDLPYHMAYDGELTFTGDGVDASSCQPTANIGTCSCIYKSHTSTEFVCTPESSCSTNTGALLDVTFELQPYGFGFMHSSKLAILAVFNSFEPTSGSTQGGTTVTLDILNIQDTECEIHMTVGNNKAILKSKDPLIFETPAGTGEADVTVTCENSNGNLPVVSRADPSIFKYDTSMTPTVQAVSLSGNTVVFNGNNFQSGMSMEIGGQTCTEKTFVDDTEVSCTLDALPATSNIVMWSASGYAYINSEISNSVEVTDLYPAEGSVYGGTLVTVLGSGFFGETTIVAIDGSVCDLDIDSSTPQQLVCRTDAHAAGTTDFEVTSNDEIATTKLTYEFTENKSPTIISLSTDVGSKGTDLEITATTLGPSSEPVTVRFNDDPDGCSVINVDPTSGIITCTVGEHLKAVYKVSLDTVLGYSNSVDFDYKHTVDPDTPISKESGPEEGGQPIVIAGSGFTEKLLVSIGGEECRKVAVTSTTYECITPPGSGTQDVTMLEDSNDALLVGSYQYRPDIGIEVVKVEPSRGGTGGGNNIVITGKRFSGSVIRVTIDGSNCEVKYSSDTEIHCTTSAHSGTITAPVVVDVDNARSIPGGATFQIFDLWSSIETWGNNGLPVEGDFVVIGPGHEVVLDTVTPVLEFLLIDGGKLSFADEVGIHVELHSKAILITGGGAFEIGTEEEPFLHDATVALYGNFSSIELPIYGTKMIAVRNGTLDMHGKEVINTWTLLAETVSKGDRQLKLQAPVCDWPVGGDIVIATTGESDSAHETEVRTIEEISDDCLTVTITQPLSYMHLSEIDTVTNTETGTVHKIHVHAEVGLLTRNIKVKGIPDLSSKDLKTCSKQIDEFPDSCTGLGAEQFGAHVIAHPPAKQPVDDQIVKMRIEYVELTHMGQAFRLGRYPIHFHIVGDASESYVRGNAIHHTFNRVVNVHDTDYLLIEKNVGYDIMGGAFFLEDGIEIGNTLRYNLAVWVIASFSLLNDDVTPACFWITTPNNTVIGCHCAGGVFGFWYRLHPHPEGPSYTDQKCPNKEIMGEFSGNVAHSVSRMGLWIFPEYFPKTDGSCWGEPDVAVFKDFTAYRCEKCAEFVDAGGVQFKNMTLAYCDVSAFDAKRIMQSCGRAMLVDSVLVGYSDNPLLQNTAGKTEIAVQLPFQSGFSLIRVAIFKFHVGLRGTTIKCICTTLCNGFSLTIENLYSFEIDYLTRLRWANEMAIIDMPGSLLGEQRLIMPGTEATVPDECTLATRADGIAVYDPNYMEAWSCSIDMIVLRLALSQAQPEAVVGKDMVITHLISGITKRVPYTLKQIGKHKPSWMVQLFDAGNVVEDKRELETILLNWDFGEPVKFNNVSFSATITNINTKNTGGDIFIVIALDVALLPDVVSIDGGKTRLKKEDTSFTAETAASLPSGSWYYEAERVFFLVRKEAGSEVCLENSIDIDVTVFKCYFADCKVPLPRGLEPVSEERHDPSQLFHGEHFGISEDGTVETVEEGGVAITSILQAGDDVTIHEKHADNSPWWILITSDSIPSISIRIGTMRVYGVLEIDYITITEDMTLTLEVEFILIYGRLIVGWPDPDRYFKGHLNIVLASLAAYSESQGAPVGEHALVVYGGLDLHGPDVTSWTTLSVTALQGEKSVQVEEDVSSWKQGDQVIITSTSYDHEETEVMTIEAVSGKTVTFTVNLKYKHTVITVGDKVIAARVALLTRQIKVMGTDGQYARVLVTQTTIAEDLYTGFARISNVEFNKVSQWGYTSPGDPRCGLTVLDTGPVPSNRPPTTVTSCAFHDLTNSGICIFNAEDVTVELSTIYGAVGNGIWTESVNTNLVSNVVSMCQFPGAYEGRREIFNNDWPGCITSLTSTVYLENNFVQGGERAGYRTCQPCDETQSVDNIAVGNVLGYAVLPTDPPTCGSCHRVSGFTFFMNINMGIYHQYTGSLVVEYNYFLDNLMGIMPIVIGGDALDHEITQDGVTVKDNTFVGDSTGECPLPALDDKTYIQLGGKSRPPLAKADGKDLKASLVLPTCTSASNKAPIKPFTNIMKYPSLGCYMKIEDNTADNMDGKCAVFLSLNKNQDDANFPVSSSNMIWGDNVEEKGKQVWPSSNLGKMNMDDCVGAVCDAMRTWTLIDLDGTFIGEKGSVIPLSEWGDNTGLTDDKIPKTVVQSVPNRGIKSKDCIQRSGSVHGYFECRGSYVSQVALESLDADSLTRRFGPVALIADDSIYLANGPQDHGYCHGYTCHERLSFFLMPILMPFDENSQDPKETIAEVHLSGDNPKMTRLFNIGARTSDCVIVKVYYAKPNRVDVMVDGEFIRPTNAEAVGDKLTYKLDSNGDLVPSCIAGATHGTNYVDRNAKMLIVALMDTQSVTLELVDQIMMKFNWPSVTTMEFFTAENLVRNIANLLGVDPSKVRVMEVVAVADNSRRRKRDTQTQYQSTIEIGPQPTGLQGEPESMATQASQLMNDCQSGAIEELVGIPGTTCGQMVYEKITYIPAIPASVGFRQTAVSHHEGVPFSTQPKLRAYDSDGNAIDHLGTVEYPWQMTAVLRNGTGHSRAVLSGTLTIQSDNGWFNFTDLEISHAGTGYIIDFYISSPSGHENMTIASDVIGVTGRPLTAGVYSMTSGHIPQSSVFTLTLELRDETTGEVIQDIDWRDHDFDVTCNLTVAMDTWTLGGSLSQTFDSVSGRGTFSDLTFSGYGLLYIGCKIESTPAEYEFYSYHEAVVVTPGQQALAIDATNIISLRFNVDYSTYLASKMAEYQLLQAITYKLGVAYSDVIISAAALSEGSIIVTLTIEGQSVNMTSMTQLLCSDISEGSTVTVGGAKLTFDAYMLVDGADYYATCASGDDDDKKSLHPGFIALIAGGAALVLGLAIVAFLLWWFKVHKKAKIHGVRKWNVAEANGDKGIEDRNSNTRYGGGFYYIDNGRTVFLAGPSHKMEKALTQQQDAYRPGSAAPLSTLYDDGGLPVRRSPHPAFRAEPSLHTDRSMTPTD